MLILSSTFVAAMVACGMLIIARVVGCRLLLRLALQPDLLAVTIPVGLIFFALGGFVLAALHWLTPWSIGLFLICLAIAARVSTAERRQIVATAEGACCPTGVRDDV
jgi:hypothetical protein